MATQPHAGDRRAEFMASDLLSSLRAMLFIRRFEERAGQMFAMGLIGGFCHLCIGQEAIALGMRQAARPGDPFIASYRMHGHLLAAGADPAAVMAELAGRRDGLSRGKGGSIHMFAPELDFYGGHGIVAAQASIGTGLAFASAYRGDGKVCMTFLGDGAADQGQFAESLAMAHRWSLPIVYVIENNRGDDWNRPALADRGAAFRIPGEEVDGMCLASVRDAGARALEWARAGHGPTLLEMRTQRYRGHSEAEPGKYRGGDKKLAPAPDPIERLRTEILDAGLAGEAELRRMDAEIRMRVADAADAASRGAEPVRADLMTDILL
ncbi:pyruvate dehydrogenase E1 component alpha subunit [Rhodoblastus acidophilus]|uniref:thiamine pyrophosphate-dependent enzyme n=1 Tax=Rhodoblastus acidophilus TaxID=1074 RepID=UPI0022246743|nr:thiamine pyrophosphate-dependent enzyme [Rhodoblastus acidophilus]MCW2317026.1 pyruvate dehydrogenase E1 component alpha subunit [Rhodoblastus acidophilus]